MSTPSNLVIADHPLIAHKLSLMRDKATPSAQFRHLLREVSLLLGYELLRDLPTELRDIETPVGPARVPFLKGKKLTFVPILRAGSGLLDGLLELVPSARVGHIGLYRNPETLEAVEYYCKLPDDIAERLAVVVDPMLATGHSAVAAIDRLKQRRRPRHPPCLPAGSAGRHRRAGARPPAGARLHRRRRCAPQRPRLHRAWPRGCRGPDVRNKVGGSSEAPKRGIGRWICYRFRSLTQGEIRKSYGPSFGRTMPR